MKKLLVIIWMTLVSGIGIGQEVCYKPYGDFEPEYETTNLLITVNWYDSVDEMNEAIGEEIGEAYSECEVLVDKDIGFCEIWTVRPTAVLGDPAIDALGHEVLHGLMGDFHE